jgi:hypothetical protein
MIDLNIVILRTIREHNIDSTNHEFYPGINFYTAEMPVIDPILTLQESLLKSKGNGFA